RASDADSFGSSARRRRTSARRLTELNSQKASFWEWPRCRPVSALQQTAWAISRASRRVATGRGGGQAGGGPAAGVELGRWGAGGACEGAEVGEEDGALGVEGDDAAVGVGEVGGELRQDEFLGLAAAGGADGEEVAFAQVGGQVQAVVQQRPQRGAVVGVLDE